MEKFFNKKHTPIHFLVRGEVFLEDMKYWNSFIPQIILFNSAVFGVVAFNYLDSNISIALSLNKIIVVMLILAVTAQIFSIIFSLISMAVFPSISRRVDGLNELLAYCETAIQQKKEIEADINHQKTGLDLIFEKSNDLNKEVKNLIASGASPQSHPPLDLTQKIQNTSNNLNAKTKEYITLVDRWTQNLNAIDAIFSSAGLTGREINKFNFLLGVIFALTVEALILYLVGILILLFSQLT